MDSNLCRLCCSKSENLLDVNLEKPMSFSAILTKHFWFLILPKNHQLQICRGCWSKTIEFHTFYKCVELAQQSYLYQQLNAQHFENTPETNIKCETEDLFEENVAADDIDCGENVNLSLKIECDSQQSCLEEENRSDHNYISFKRKEKLSKARIIKSRNGEVDIRAKKQVIDSQIREYFKMQCDICSIAGFHTLAKAQHHYRTSHQQDGYLSCCDRKFFNRREIVRHIRQHTHSFKCEICNKSSVSKESLKIHMEKHVPNNLKEFPCAVCPKAFMTKYRLTYHTRLRHCTETDKKIECPQCKRKFLMQSMLTSHMKNFHDAANAQICDICAKSFKNKYSLASHQTEVHGTKATERMTCDLCGSTLKNLLSYKKHMRYHNDTPRQCVTCKKIYPNKNSLNSHMRSVHSEKNFACTICDKAFRVRVHLTEHIACMHTGHSLYSCGYCGQMFKSNGNLYQHKKKVHTEDWQRDRQKRGKLKLNSN